MGIIPFMGKKDWRKDVDQLSAVCSRLRGTFIPDDDEKVFACVVSDRGLNISYFREKDLYLVALTGDGMLMSVTSKHAPDFFIANNDFAVTVEKPETAKAYTITPTNQEE